MIEEIKAKFREDFDARIARKREEFEAALERDEVADPVTAVLVGWAKYNTES